MKKTDSKEKNKSFFKKAENIFNEFLSQRAGCYAIIIIVSLVLYLIFNRWNIIEANDARLHYQKFLLTRKTIINGGGLGQMLYFSYAGAGNPCNFLYAPLSTYLIVVISFVVKNILQSVDIFTAMITVVTGISMFEMTKEITKNNKIALLSAALYMVCPYRLQNIYARFAIGEYTAMAFTPLVILGLYNVFNGDKKKEFCIALGAIGVFLSHTLTLELLAAVSVLYVLFNLKKINKEIILIGIKNVVIILLATCMFWIPLLEYKLFGDYGIFDVKVMTLSLDIQENACSIFELIGTNSKARMTLEIGIIQFVLFIFTMIVFKKIKKKKYFKTYIFFLVLISGLLIMSTKYFPWNSMPGFMKMIQYPWRLIGMIEIFISAVAAINIFELVNVFAEKIKEEKDLKEIDNNKIEKVRNIILIIFLILDLILAQYYHNRIQTVLRNYNSESEYTDYLKNKNMQTFLDNVDKVDNLNVMMTNREYLPQKGIENKEAYQNLNGKIHVISGNVEIENEQKTNLNVSADLKNIQEGTSIELPLNYYPGYKIEIIYKDENNNIVETKQIKYNESDIGYIKLDFDENIENASINIQYTGTILEKASLGISIISLIGWGIYEISKNKFYIKSKNV